MGKRHSQISKKSVRARTWKYQLSVGIIFKNEIRCLERCLTSLLPLKEHVSCQIVMADTGATDGSRQIAEKFADILFDFPWIDDFSAARNAVLERCTGEWFLYVDCDQWFEDVEPLVRFLNSRPDPKICRVVMMEYHYISMTEKSYTEFLTSRLIRMSYRPHFTGAIHEYIVMRKGGIFKVLLDVIVHHDGYVCLNDGSEEGIEKRRRNIRLLRQELEKDPNNLRTLAQFIDSGQLESDYLEYLNRAVSLVISKVSGWEEEGPLIFSRATVAAWTQKLPTLREWARQAEELFPNSYFVRVDVNGTLCNMYQTEDFAECIRRGRAYLKAREDWHGDSQALLQLAKGPLLLATNENDECVKLLILRAVANTGTLEELVDCVAELRQILQNSPQKQQQIELILQELETRKAQLQAEQDNSNSVEISSELRELAEKVRAILAAYPPDDPAVATLKATPVYQKVAHLLEDAAGQHESNT